MKKPVAVLTALILMILLVSCWGGGKSTPSPTATETAVSERPVMALCFFKSAPASAAGSSGPVASDALGDAFCGNVEGLGIRADYAALVDLFGAASIPDSGDITLVICADGSAAGNGRRYAAVSSIPLRPGKAGLSGSGISASRGVAQACQSGKGAMVPHRQSTAWGPLGGPGPGGVDTGAAAQTFSCSARNNPYGEASEPSWASVTYRTIRALYELGNGVVNQVQDREIFKLGDGSLIDEYYETEQGIFKDVIGILAEEASEEAWAEATEAELAAAVAGSFSTEPSPAAVEAGAAAAAALRAAEASRAAAKEAQQASDPSAAYAAYTEAERQRDLAKKERERADKAADKASNKDATEPPESPDGGGEAGIPSDNTSTCAGMDTQFRECDASKWKSGPCVALLAKIRNCADPGIINPGPDGSLVCGGETLLTDDELATAILKACGGEVAHPVPDGDFCTAAVSGKGGFVIAKFPECPGDPLAYCSADPKPSGGGGNLPKPITWWCPPSQPPMPPLPCIQIGGPRPNPSS
jgi:hypothetical protein